MNETIQEIGDAEQRSRALDPHHSFIVQAPAGSGKTELLIQRYLTLLARVHTAPEEILAITFTRKAATEMRLRILKALQSAQATPPTDSHQLKTHQLAIAVLERDRQHQWELVENPNRLKIQTIDSFCAYLTQRLPLLAKFGFQPSICENAAELYIEAARLILAGLENNASWSKALENLFFHLDNDYGKVENLLVNMLANREQWLKHLLAAKNSQNARVELELALQHIVESILTKLTASFPQEFANELIYLANFAANNVATEDAISCCRELTTLPKNHLSDQKYWIGIAKLLLTTNFSWREKFTKNQGFPASSNVKNKEEKAFFENMKQRILSLVEQFKAHKILHENLQAILTAPPIHYTDKQWQLIADLIELLPLLAAQLRLVFKQHNQVDYIEITIRALAALGEPEAPTDLALALDHQIQHILLDEFQDTSVIQYQLLEKLTAGWMPGDGRTLFLVGDPMQSIYRFRKAEVGLFLRAREEGIGSIKLIPLNLNTNFRAHHGMVSWINKIFAQLLPLQEDIGCGAIPFNPCTAIRDHHAAESIFFHPLINQDNQAEANKVVSIVRASQQQNPHHTIAILVKARTHLTEILPALNAANITYRATEIESLTHCPTIQDLFALTRALLHPADRIAWLAILRAPWCGLTLKDLHTIASDDPHATIWELLHQQTKLDAISNDGKPRILRFLEVIKQSLGQRQRKSLRIWIEGTWHALGGPACLQDMSAFNHAKTFFELIEKIENGGELDLLTLKKNLEQLYISSQYLKETQPLLASVEVMTIHKAKGLEFDEVILPCLHRQSPSDDQQLLLWMEHPSEHTIDLLFGPIKASTEDNDPIYDYVRQEEKKKADYEMGRLLYVAVTRAKNTLHLIGQLQKEKEEFKKPASGSFFFQLWNMLEIELTCKAVKETPILEKPPLTTSLSVELLRLPANWKIPLPNNSCTEMNSVKVSTSMEDSLIPTQLLYQPKINLSRQIGILLHRILRIISLQGYAQWHENRIAKEEKYWRYSLMQLGIAGDALEQAIQITKTAVINTLQDERGIWILSPHQHANSEYELTAIINDEIKSIIMDRTFVDEKNVRWIIDYKITSYAGNDKEFFLAAEQARHQAQLTNYANILSQFDNRNIRLGLYFPLLQAWREWTF